MLSPNHNHQTPGKITLDLSATLGEYSGLENMYGVQPSGCRTPQPES
jgi:hypothetical protein